MRIVKLLKNSMRKKESSVELILVSVQLVNVSGKINAGKGSRQNLALIHNFFKNLSKFGIERNFSNLVTGIF